MCGIAGFTIADGDLSQMNTAAMTFVLGYEMMSRGKDATGIATIDKRGRWKVRKNPYAADVFLASRRGIGEGAQSALIHTRAATQGKADKPGNNHPIVTGSIIGIHNGMLFNDDRLFAHFKWERHAEVDSEAIFAALNHLGTDEGLLQIDGSWAISWINTDQDPRVVWLARGSSSPLCYATTKNGSVVFASTASAVKEAFEYGGVKGVPDVAHAPEGFLAHTNPEGGLVILPAFDPSGDKAIGARPSKTTYGSTYVNGSAYVGGFLEQWEGDYGSRWRKPESPQTAFVRVPISGDPKNPKIGDRRRYFDSADKWHIEVCTGLNPGKWNRLETTIEPENNSPKELSPTGEWLTGDDDGWEFGFAHPGDTITFTKSMLGDLTGGHIAAEVIDEDEDTKELVVEFRRTRISKYAEYAVCLKTPTKGA